MSTPTTNYGIGKFDATDTFTRASFNNNYEVIDEAIAQVQANLDAHNGDAHGAGDPKGFQTRAGLARFARSLGYIREGGLDVVCLGDSIFEGAYSPDYYAGQWAHRLRQLLQRHYNPEGVTGGYGYMPFAYGGGDASVTAWNALYADTIPVSKIFWGVNGSATHVLYTDYRTGIRGIDVTHGTRWRYRLGGDTAKRRNVTDIQFVGQSNEYMPSVTYDVFEADDFGAAGAGALTGSISLLTPQTRWGYHAARVTFGDAGFTLDDGFTLQFTAVGGVSADGVILYDGDYDQGLRLHNLACIGNWAYSEYIRREANVQRWAVDATGGAQNARLFLLNMITNDYLSQSEVSYTDLANFETYYGLLLDEILSQPTTPCVMVVIPPKPGGAPGGAASYQDYVDVIYALAATRPDVAILDVHKIIGLQARDGLPTSLGWNDADNVHFTPRWQEYLAQLIAQTIIEAA
jgi:hypothetical protein